MGMNAVWSVGTGLDRARAYLFRPPLSLSSDVYTYVSECSNRGSCDTDSGVCSCFTGYAGDDCSVQYNVLQ